MLYDKRWDKPEVKADPFKLETFIAWLERQPAEKSYCYSDGGDCLIHQYLSAHLIPVEYVWSGGRYTEADGSTKRVPSDFWNVSIGDALRSDWTFGKALRRARARARCPQENAGG